ncbi:MAG: hypothetical protein J4G04_00960 [Nitrosopumilaceae archaeon]|nr:hypothetical protein [Nitrosopumilaceae archaeon]
MARRSLDPALTLSLSEALLDAVQVAGVVRSDILDGISGADGTASLDRIFGAARAAVRDGSGGAVDRGNFEMALNAAIEADIDPIAWFVYNAAHHNIPDAMCDIPKAASNKAAADAFATAFPEEATSLIDPKGPRPDHLMMLNGVRRRSLIYPFDSLELPPMREDCRTESEFFLKKMSYMAGEDMGRASWEGARDATTRTYYMAVGPAGSEGPGTAVDAAVAAVFGRAVAAIRGPAFRRAAEDIRAKLPQMAAGMEEAPVGAVELAADEMVAGVASCRDGASAADEVARLAPRIATERAAERACRNTFLAVYGTLAAGAYATCPDQRSFESSYGDAVRAAAGLGRATYPGSTALDYFADEHDVMIDYDAMEEGIWMRYFAAGGRTMSEWASDALHTDYRETAGSGEHAGLIDLYRATYETASEGAARAISDLKRSGW